MTPTVLRILSLALGPIVLQLIFCFVDKKNGMELIKNLRAEHVVLRFPIAYPLVFGAGVLFSGSCLSIMIFYPNGTEAGWVYAFFFIFLITTAYLVLYTVTWKLECFRSEDFFVYRLFFRKERKVFYRDVDYYHFETGGFKIKTKTSKIPVGEHVTNIEIILAMLSKHGVPEKK